jgi:hypothetical protein
MTSCHRDLDFCFGMRCDCDFSHEHCHCVHPFEEAILVKRIDEGKEYGCNLVKVLAVRMWECESVQEFGLWKAVATAYWAVDGSQIGKMDWMHR